jgi:hypothetical protein
MPSTGTDEKPKPYSDTELAELRTTTVKPGAPFLTRNEVKRLFATFDRLITELEGVLDAIYEACELSNRVMLEGLMDGLSVLSERLTGQRLEYRLHDEDGNEHTRRGDGLIAGLVAAGTSSLADPATARDPMRSSCCDEHRCRTEARTGPEFSPSPRAT